MTVTIPVVKPGTLNNRYFHPAAWVLALPWKVANKKGERERERDNVVYWKTKRKINDDLQERWYFDRRARKGLSVFITRYTSLSLIWMALFPCLLFIFLFICLSLSLSLVLVFLVSLSCALLLSLSLQFSRPRACFSFSFRGSSGPPLLFERFYMSSSFFFPSRRG